MNSSSSALRILAGLAVLGLAFPAPTATAPSQADQLAPGPVIVRVSDGAGGGAALPGAIVRLGGRVATTGPDGAAVVDGAPAGDYELGVELHGYDLHRSGVTLSRGAREPFDVALIPSVLVPVEGLVSLEGGGPLAGARVELECPVTASGRPSRCELSTDWEGRFRVLELPAGDYLARLSAAGCEERELRVDVKADVAPIEIAMSPITESVSARVLVRDSVSGQAIAGAAVTIAEAWPKGILASATTGGDGGAGFDGLQIARLNWRNEDESIAASTGRGMARVEAEGYESAIAPFPGRIGGTLEVAMNPTAAIAEEEDNDSIASAQTIRTGAPVELRIDEVGDHDCFRFHLDQPSHLRLTLGPNNPLFIYMRLLAIDGTELGSSSGGAGGEVVLEANVARGDYMVLVQQYYDNQASPEPTTLLVERTVIADPFEPNDDEASARRIRSGEEVRGYVFPMADHDCYRFAMERPGWIRLTMPPSDLWRYVELRDEEGKVLAGPSGGIGAPLEHGHQLPAGRYTLTVRQYYDNALSLEPYVLRLETIEDDLVDDPAELAGQPLRAVRSLEVGQHVGATILPNADVDRFALSLPEPGVLHVHLHASVWSYFRLRGTDGAELARASASAGQAGEMAWVCQEPRGVVLEVRSYYDNESSPLPYHLTTWWEPADELDVLARNETVEEATPWILGETLRGSIHPVGDHDVYRVEVDHPGILHLEGTSAVWGYTQVRDGKGAVLGYAPGNAGQPFALALQVLPGEYSIDHHQYYDNQASPLPYEIRARLERVDVEERVPLAEGSPIPLRLGEVRPFRIEHLGDHDTFRFSIPDEGPFWLRVHAPVWTYIRVFDERSGAQVFAQWPKGNEQGAWEIPAEGPASYRLELQQYYDNVQSMGYGWILVGREDRPLVGGLLEAVADPADPTAVSFTLRAQEGVAPPTRAVLDADGDGGEDAALPLGQPVVWRYPAPGRYTARARLTGSDGTTGFAPAWVDAVGVQPREGVQVVVRHPAEGAVIETADPCRVSAISYTGAGIRRVDFAIDGRNMGTAYNSPFAAELPWDQLGPGEHTLRVTAVDGRGDEGVVERTIRLSDYYELLPASGTKITGDDVAVSWTGPDFGRAAVRFRPEGEEEWRQQEGERSRERRVVLRELEPDRAYEIQPLGSGDPGPIRLVTRVRGLSFGKDRYAGTIERDYDQRLGITVRNSADAPMRVLLTCGEPPADSELLVGFLGQGSEGVPFDLEPEEERDFLLGLSAQDVDVPNVRFPVRITSDTGYADEAEVSVDVRLPEVKLRWEEVTAANLDQLVREYILHNDGDGLTDFALQTESDQISISPMIGHGVFPPGDTLKVSVRPRLYEGFAEAQGEILAEAVGQQVQHGTDFALPDGKQIFGVQLVAGAGILDEDSDDDEVLLAARAMAGAYLNPDSVDWSQLGDPVDTDGDGRIDRWSLDDELEGILWVGDDTTGDGEIDFVHADIGSDGQYDYSAFRLEDGWQETNLVEAWLEMGFDLPMDRELYEAHDLDLVMNGQVVGELRDQLPEGNYLFRLPPTAIRFNEEGVPEGNEIEVQSKHLRGGHYYVVSDFRIKVRMTGTRVWVVAGSEEEARRSVRDTEGLTVEGPDYSISSAELTMTGVPARGAELLFSVPVRNVGATRTAAVAVALMKKAPDGQMFELASSWVEEVPLTGARQARVSWIASSGAHTLWVVVDPDGESGDVSEANNRAAITVVVPGDDAPPEVSFVEPAEGAVLTDTVVPVVVEARDDDAVARVAISIDGGLASPLRPLPEAGRWAGQVLLQPGGHRLTATALDASNHSVEASVSVTVKAPTPSIEIESPAEGSQIDQRRVTVSVRADEDAKIVAGRVNGGPWVPGRLEGGEGSIELELTFGPCAVEVMATNSRGARGTDRRSITCTAQPEEEEEEEPEEDPPGDGEGDGKPDGQIDVDGVGEIDALGPPNAPIRPKDTPRGPREGEEEPGDAPPTAGGGRTGGSGSEPEEPPTRVGCAPATDEQPDTLPPASKEGELPPEEEPEPGEEPEEEEYDEPLVEPGEVLAGPGPRRAAPRSRPSRPRGGFIGARARQKDWYCTNRPKIKVKFRLPDWLKNKKLPKPGTKEFDSMMARLLVQMRMRGIDTKKLELFQKSLMRRIDGMNQPGELPGLLESFGFAGPVPEDHAALKAMRDKMKCSAQAWFLRLLASGDPMMVAKGLKARAEAIGQFDKAMLEHAQGAMKEIEGNQQLVEDIAEALPVVGEMSDLYAVVTGETALAGRQVSALERAIRLAGVVGPFGLEQLIKRSPTTRMILQGIGEMGEAAGKAGRRMLAGVLNLPPGKVDDGIEAITKFLTKERRLVGETMEDKMAREARLFAKSPEGIADATRQLKDHAEARDLVNKLRKADPGSDEFVKATRELQSNKTAQALINRADVPDALRKEVNKNIKGWYKAADEGVAEGFESLYRHGKPDASETARIANEMGITVKQAEEFQEQVAEFARKNGIEPSEVVVDKLTITNRRPPKPGEVPRTSVGRDRDVTFQLQGPKKDPVTKMTIVDGATGKPRMVAEDIHHTVSKGPYEREFYKASKGDLPRVKGTDAVDSAAVTRYSEDAMDQAVTSYMHPEAYNTGEVLLDDFLDKGITPTITRVDDVCDTVQYKSDHWFHKADELSDATSEASQGLSKTERLTMASRNTQEGMRQATKQYDDLVCSRVRQYGLDPNVHVPPRLQQSMDIFRQVKDGKISPAKAEAMLKAIGSSKEGAVREMAGFLNGLEKTAGVGWRKVKAKELVNKLAGMQRTGGGNWQDDALDAINNSLKKGELTPTQFTRLRSDVTRGTVTRLKAQYPSQWKKHLKEWAGQARERRLISAVEKAALDRETGGQ